MGELREKIRREMRSGVYTLLILKAIDDVGESYGYEIQRHISERTGGVVNIKDATVYPVLRYLTKKKILRAYWTEPGKGVPRKYYALTEEGRKLLRQLIDDYENFTYSVLSMLRGEGK